jgi:hypothetical protein
MSSKKFVPNSTGTVFLKCDDNPIKNKSDFYLISPFSVAGEKTSNRIWRDELGLGSLGKRKGQKTYYGDKSYINSRIAYNKCSPRSSGVWQKYNDVASGSESFLAGALPSLFNRDYQPTSSSGYNYKKYSTPTTQLLNDEEYKRLLSSRKTIKLDDNVEPELNTIEVDERGRRYTTYPGTNVYFSCSDAEEKLVEESKDGNAIEYIKRKIAENNAGSARENNAGSARENNAGSSAREQKDSGREEKKEKDKPNTTNAAIYCGSGTMENIIKAKMCRSYPAPTFDHLSFVRLGSPGQCFQYGKRPNDFPQFSA